MGRNCYGPKCPVTTQYTIRNILVRVISYVLADKCRRADAIAPAIAILGKRRHFIPAASGQGHVANSHCLDS